jgi:predicted ATPase
VLFVDLGMIGDPGLVTTAVASMLGLTVQTEDATPNLIAYLRNRDSPPSVSDEPTRGKPSRRA